MGELEANAPKKMLKESLVGKAVTGDPELQEMQEEIAILRSEKILLMHRFDFFNGAFETISRVITRKSWERNRG